MNGENACYESVYFACLVTGVRGDMVYAPDNLASSLTALDKAIAIAAVNVAVCGTLDFIRSLSSPPLGNTNFN